MLGMKLRCMQLRELCLMAASVENLRASISHALEVVEVRDGHSLHVASEARVHIDPIHVFIHVEYGVLVQVLVLA